MPTKIKQSLREDYRLNPKSNWENISFFFLPLLIFFVSPPISFLFIFIFFIREKREMKNVMFLLSLIFCLYVSIINATKSVAEDMDLQWYTEQYLNAGTTPYLDYIYSFGINGQGKELFFPTFNYILHFFIGDSILLYRISHSFICYALFSFAIYRFTKAVGIKPKVLILGFSSLIFFPLIFTYSATLFRQFLAVALLSNIIIEKFYYNKKMYFLSICMFLTHTSTLFFIPLIYLNFLNKQISKKHIIYYVIAFSGIFFMQKISMIALGFLGNINPALTYVLERASKETTFILPPLGIGKITFLLLQAFFPLYIYSKSQQKSPQTIHFLNIILLLNVFILINLEQLELSNRFFLYSTALLPFSITYIAHELKWNLLIISGLCLILFSTFIYYVHLGYYTFSIGIGTLIFPLFNI